VERAVSRIGRLAEPPAARSPKGAEKTAQAAVVAGSAAETAKARTEADQTTEAHPFATAATRCRADSVAVGLCPRSTAQAILGFRLRGEQFSKTVSVQQQQKKKEELVKNLKGGACTHEYKTW
jgi:hypothetical protein